MLKKMLSSFFVAGLVFLSQAQVVGGIITSSETRQPIPYANVFLSGTLVGTTSDLDGKYALTLDSKGRFQLVVTCVGYEDYIQELEFEGKDLKLDIALQTKVRELKEVNVNPDTSNWKNDFITFNKLFLGSTRNALETKITNPKEVFVFYDAIEKGLYAHSRNELVVRNDALGYRVRYILKEFQMDYNTGQFRSFGIPRFEALETQNNRRQKKWKKQRERAYLGSFQHFLDAVVEDDLSNQGFIAQALFKVPNRERPPQDLIDRKLAEFKGRLPIVSGVSFGGSLKALPKDSITSWKKRGMIPSTLNVDSLMRNSAKSDVPTTVKMTPDGMQMSGQATDSLNHWIKMNKLPVLVDSVVAESKSKASLIDSQNNFSYTGFLQITYTKESEEPAYASSITGSKPNKKQVSEVHVQAPFKIYENGYFDVTKMIFYGYLGWSQRMAEMLPLGFKPSK